MKGTIRYTIKHMKHWAEYRKGKCLSTEFLGMEKKLTWMCRKGHTWELTPFAIRQGAWCPVCDDGKNRTRKRHTLEEMQQIAKKKGGKCLAESYRNGEEKLEWQCRKKHRFKMSPAKIIYRNYWCPICAQRQKGTIEEMQEYAKKQKGKCLSKVYIDRNHNLDWQCEKGHKWSSDPHCVLRGSWCPFCAGKRNDLKEAKRLAKERGGKCLSTKYINTKTKMKWQCAEGHIWFTPFHNIRSGTWCSHYECRYKNVIGKRKRKK